jgi:hypothetical protein
MRILHRLTLNISVGDPLISLLEHLRYSGSRVVKMETTNWQTDSMLIATGSWRSPSLVYVECLYQGSKEYFKKCVGRLGASSVMIEIPGLNGSGWNQIKLNGTGEIERIRQ